MLNRTEKFFWSLVMRAYVNDEPIHTIEKTFGVDQGKLAKLKDSLERHTNMAATMCQRLGGEDHGWHMFEKMINTMGNRMTHGVKEGLLELVVACNGNVDVAKELHKRGGHRTGADILRSTVQDLAKMLKKRYGKFAERRAREVHAHARAKAAKDAAEASA